MSDRFHLFGLCSRPMCLRAVAVLALSCFVAVSVRPVLAQAEEGTTRESTESTAADDESSEPGDRSEEQTPAQETSSDESEQATRTEEEVIRQIERPVSTEPQPGDIVGLLYTDGRRLEAVLLGSDEQRVVVRISAIEVTIKSEDIQRLYRIGTPMERYFELREGVSDDDAATLLEISRFCERYDLMDIALMEAKFALRAEPRNSDAARRVNRLERIVELRKLSKSTEQERTKTNPVRTPRRSGESSLVPVLSLDQINRIKVYELDLRDPPRITIPDETVDRLLRDYRQHELIPNTEEGRESFRAMPASKILDVMFRVQARELYGTIRVAGDVKSMEAFRERVQMSWLIASCASRRCHGGPDAGEMQLVTRNVSSDAAVYTNFVILDQFRTSWDQPLFDWNDPASSVIIQHALPRDSALWPHPEVDGWSPGLRPGSRDIERTVEWMQMMYRPRPDYDLDYPPQSKQDQATPTPAEKDTTER